MEKIKNLRPRERFHALSKTKVSDKRMNQSPRYHFVCFPFRGNRSCAIHQSRCRVTEANRVKLLPAHRILLTCWQGIFRGLLQYRLSPYRGSLFCRGPGNLSCVIAFPCCFCCFYYIPIHKICQTHFSTNKDHNLTSISFNSSLSHRFAAIKQPESQSNVSISRSAGNGVIATGNGCRTSHHPCAAISSLFWEGGNGLAEFAQPMTRCFMPSTSSTPREKPFRTSSSGTYSSYFSKTGTSFG